MRFKKTDRPQKFSFSIETLCRRISTIAAYPSSSTIGEAFSFQEPPRGPFHTVVPRTPSLPSSHERCSIMVLGFVTSARTSACGAYQSSGRGIVPQCRWMIWPTSVDHGEGPSTIIKLHHTRLLWYFQDDADPRMTPRTLLQKLRYTMCAEYHMLKKYGLCDTCIIIRP
jgi:hypothetical protein